MEREFADIVNPFDAAIVKDLWTDPPDVGSINEAVSRALLKELDAVRRNGESRGVVVQGPAGSGKTHLLARLRRSIAREKSGFLVHVPPHAGLDGEFFRHVLYHLAVSLERPGRPAGPWPFRELFASFAVRKVLGRSGQVRVGPAAQREILEKGRALLLAEAPGADPDVLTALAGLFRGQAALACDWLRGQILAEEELGGLGLSAPVDSEDRALRVIQALSALAWLGGRPLVICFDQVDAYAADERRKRFAEVAAALVHARGNLVLTMCLVDTWKAIEKAAPAPLIQRLVREGKGPLQMVSLSPVQLRELLTLRLEEVFRGRPRPHPLFPFTPEDLAGIEGGAVGRIFPRQALNEASRRFDAWLGRAAATAQAGLSLDGLLQRSLEERTPAPPPDEIQARSLARSLLERLLGTVPPPQGLEGTVDFLVQGVGKVGVVFLGGKDARALWRRLWRILEAAGKDLDRIVVVRDARLELGVGAIKTREYLERVAAGPATCLHLLEPEELSAWQGLQALVDRAAAGDLLQHAEGVPRGVTREEAGFAMKASVRVRELPLVRRLEAWAARERADGELEALLLGLLAARPVQDLARLRAGIGPKIPEDRVRATLQALERRGAVRLHTFQGEVQVRRA